MLRLLPLLTLAFPPLLATSQVVTVRGTIRDQQSNEKVPFVHLRVTNTAYGTSSNLDGNFEIKLDLSSLQEQQRSVTFSCIGYQSRVVPASEMKLHNDISLVPNTTSLLAITVTGKKSRKRLINQGRRIAQRAFRSIPVNYHTATVLYPSFYRHYCAENETYVRLIEAALEVYRPGKAPYQALYPEQNMGFQVNQLRRSFDFTESARLSHPSISLNFLLTNDLTAYEYNNPFFSKRPINYALRDTTTLGDEQIAVIDFNSSATPSNPESFDGTLYVSLDDYAFVKTEVHERFHRRTISDSMNLHITKLTFYKPQGDKYFVDREISDLKALHLSYDTLGQVRDSVVHTSHIELITNDVLLDPNKKIEGGEPTKEDLRQINYDSAFWETYTILEATDLEKKIIEDLSQRLQLKKQFSMFNDIEKGGRSVISSMNFQQVIQPYLGTPTYVILWASWAYPNGFDIESIPYLARRLKRDQCHIVLISLDHDEEEWQQSRVVYQLNRKGVRHERLDFEFDSEIAERYFRNVLPFRCVLDAEGVVVPGTPPLPNEAAIQDFLQPILQNRNAAKTETPTAPDLQTQN